jgi:hypothetical protein
VQRLALEGLLPTPSKHGCCNLRACGRAWRLHQRHVAIPTSVAAAIARFIEARDVLEECIHRHPAQRPTHYTTAADCMGPLRDLEPMLPPQAVDLRKASDTQACAVTGLALFAFEAVFPGQSTA